MPLGKMRRSIVLVLVNAMFPPLSAQTVLRERYRITDIVGHGGMGCVYRAADLRLPGRFCAVKEVHIDPTQSAEAQVQSHDQFLREASILAQLDHPGLPKVSDFFTEGNREYLVMDFVPGQDLKQVIDDHVRANRFIDEANVLAWSEQIIDALVYLHGRTPPALHRDIKPSNIKLTPDNRIKLVDFGLVKLLAPGDRTLTLLQGRGTALYTPLEQYGGDSGHTSPASDIYALGATLYHLLANQPPPQAKTRFLDPQALAAPHAINPAVSKTVSDAVCWAMAMHPDERPADVATLGRALTGDVSRAPAVADSAETIADALAPNTPLLISAAVLLVIAVLVTIL